MTRVCRAWKRSIAATTVAEAGVGSSGYVIRLPLLGRRQRWVDGPPSGYIRSISGERRATESWQSSGCVDRRRRCGKAPTTGRKGQLYHISKRRSPWSPTFHDTSWVRWLLASTHSPCKIPSNDFLAHRCTTTYSSQVSQRHTAALVINGISKIVMHCPKNIQSKWGFGSNFI